MNTDQSDFTPSDNFQTREQLNEFFRGLRELDHACRANGSKHDRAIALICACIDEGVDTGARIVGALKRLGFNAQHVGKLLHDYTGNDPSRHHWQRDEAGRYSNHC